MLAITYSMKKEIKVAKWGTPKKNKKKEKKKEITHTKSSNTEI
jgi:hypothetical protein